MRTRPARLALLAVLLCSCASISHLSGADDEADNKLYVEVNVSADLRFGIVQTAATKNPGKQLTFSPRGETNNAIARINGKDMFLHKSKNSTFKVKDPDDLKEEKSDEGPKWKCTWEVASPRVNIVQELAIRRGDQTGRFDTVVVRYLLENQSKATQKLGLRFMLDTLIGRNDGVPFTIPEKAGLCTTQLSAKKRELPDYIQALEKPDLKNPGTIAHLGVKVSAHYGVMDPPDMLQIAHWPGPDAWWQIPNVDFGDDSMVGLYWDEAAVKPGESRKIGFTYGLANVVSGGSAGKIGLTTGGVFKVGGEFILTAYVDANLKRATLQIVLPEGLKLSPGPPAKQTVAMRPTDPYGKISWRIRCQKAGTYEIPVEMGDGVVEKTKVVVRDK